MKKNITKTIIASTVIAAGLSDLTYSYAKAFLVMNERFKQSQVLSNIQAKKGR